MATKLEQHAIRKRSGIDRAIRQAERQLAAADPVMKRLIAQHGRRAAATIKQRVGAFVGVPFQTDKVLSVPQELLRSAGLSAAKARYIRELAARVCDGRLNFIELMTFDDEPLIEKLIESPGIGRWTAEMFLLFGLKRLDVLALGDAGLQRAARLLYGKKRKSLTLLPRIAEAWRPYRSIASWYLWRSLESN